ncbi:hypothetical protein Stuart_4 [Providencia phage vB_PstP_PS3]|uniref:Uncharacterized protein n=1 Tax=Providencia phage vB_PstP_PS3 TaxID=2848038 RepID=A0A411AWH2_9CAUD|nr:hypothetical protein HOV05_gp04 [Providencia phage vB_PstP_PS3]QAX92420.1 hypothetical protein Stuart_4 [Providencia phage vB_PstP_PS3]
MVKFTFTNITLWAKMNGFQVGESFDALELFEGDYDPSGLPTESDDLPCVVFRRPSNGDLYILSNCNEEGVLSCS